MTLREATIKLAQENPELRKHLIPILRRTRQASRLNLPGYGDDLVMWMDNDSFVYRQMESIRKNLMRKIVNGKYDPRLAVKLWMYAVETGAKALYKSTDGYMNWDMNGNSSRDGEPFHYSKWPLMFPKKHREAVAAHFAREFEQQVRDGELTPEDYGVKKPLPEGFAARWAGDKAKTEEGAEKLYKEYKEKHPNTEKTPKDFYEAPKDDEKPKDEGKKPEDEKKPDDSDDEKKDDGGGDDDDEYDVSTESFKKDFDPKDFNGFDGWVGVRFPNEAAEDVSQPGSADEAVKHWVKELGWNVPADEARQYLTEAGIEEERVEEMDEDDLNEYTFWLAAGQQHENDYEDGRLASLRRATIKLAHDMPELRKYLVPLLKRAFELEEQKFTHPDTGNKVNFKSLPEDMQKRLRRKQKKQKKHREEKEEYESGEKRPLGRQKKQKRNPGSPIKNWEDVGIGDVVTFKDPKSGKKVTKKVKDGWNFGSQSKLYFEEGGSINPTETKMEWAKAQTRADKETPEQTAERKKQKREDKTKGKKDEGEKPKRSVADVKKELDLTDDDEKEVGKFKKKLKNYKKMTDAQLMQKFMREAKPETKERMKGMSVADFMIMFKSIMDEEEGGEGGKTATAQPTPLRNAVMKLAHDVPEMRKHLIPILRRTAAGCGDEQMAGRLWKGEPGKGYGMTGPDVRGPGNWTPEAKGKCYYETGDEADRCYVTTKGGPGGQTKPKTRGDKDYEEKRWPGGRPRS